MLQEKGLKKDDYEVNPVGGTDARLEAMPNDPNAVAASSARRRAPLASAPG